MTETLVLDSRIFSCACGLDFSGPALLMHRLAGCEELEERIGHYRGMRLPAWTLSAACRKPGAALLLHFFPEEGKTVAQEVRASLVALEMCASCPVRMECFEWGRKEEFGVFGGTVPKQREERSWQTAMA